jgi:hypothetical protein
MPLSFLYLYEAPPHPAFYRDNCHSKSDVIKHMLSAPVLKGRLGKWMFALSEFDIQYQPAKAVKGQALADLVAERTSSDIVAISIRAWAMYFDGSVCGDGSSNGILLVSPWGATYSFSI